jgi:uncharacterized protein
MLSNPANLPAFRRAAFATLRTRLLEPRRFINVVAGPRQVGKTTLIRQVVAELHLPVHLVSADDPGLRSLVGTEPQDARHNDANRGIIMMCPSVRP